MAELVHEDGGADDGVVVNQHLTRDFCRISYDEVVAKETVMGDMDVFHQKAMVAYLSRTFGSRTSGYVHILTKTVEVSYLANAILAFEFQVLGLGGNASTCKELIVVADSRTIIDGDTVLQHIVVAQYRVTVDIAEWTYDVVVAQLGIGMHIGHGTDLVHIQLLLGVLYFYLFIGDAYLFFTICAVKVASATTWSPTNM